MTAEAVINAAALLTVAESGWWAWVLAATVLLGRRGLPIDQGMVMWTLLGLAEFNVDYPAGSGDSGSRHLTISLACVLSALPPAAFRLVWLALGVVALGISSTSFGFVVGGLGAVYLLKVRPGPAGLSCTERTILGTWLAVWAAPIGLSSALVRVEQTILISAAVFCAVAGVVLSRTPLWFHAGAFMALMLLYVGLVYPLLQALVLDGVDPLVWLWLCIVHHVGRLRLCLYWLALLGVFFGFLFTSAKNEARIRGNIHAINIRKLFHFLALVMFIPGQPLPYPTSTPSGPCLVVHAPQPSWEGGVGG